MPDAPRRKRFQIHLSTAIVLMFMAGALIWANVHIWELESSGTSWSLDANKETVMRQMSEAAFLASETELEWEGERKSVYGWPAPTKHISCKAWASNQRRFDNQSKFRMIGERAEQWNTTGIIFNSLVAFVLLYFVWSICERLIRRRAMRKDA